jgi:hypothetical protein
LRAADGAALAATLRGLDFRTITTADGEFDHPNLIAVLTPDRRLASYLFGVGFSPTALARAVRDARTGVPEVARWRAPLFVFAVVGFAASAFVFFTLLGRRRHSSA